MPSFRVPLPQLLWGWFSLQHVGLFSPLRGGFHLHLGGWLVCHWQQCRACRQWRPLQPYYTPGAGVGVVGAHSQQKHSRPIDATAAGGRPAEKPS